MIEIDGLRLSESYAKIYTEQQDRLQERFSLFCDEKALFETADEYGLFGKYREEILMAVKDLPNRKDLATLAAICDIALDDKATCRSGDTVFPIGRDPAHRYYTLLPVLHHMKNVAKMLQKRGLPEKIIRDTLYEYEISLEIFRLHNGQPGFNKRFLEWTMLICEDSLLKIGRFNFQPRAFKEPFCALANEAGEVVLLADGVDVHTSGMVLGSAGCTDRKGAFRAEVQEDEAGIWGFAVGKNQRIETNASYFRKSEWQISLRKGDPVLAVHIPRVSSLPLTEEVCEQSYAQAKEIFAQHYPEFDPKAFSCESWMMNRELTSILGENSNISRFQRAFVPFPVESAANAIFSFIFQFPDGADMNAIDYSALSEDTTLRRKVKEILLSGGYIHEAGGIMLI